MSRRLHQCMSRWWCALAFAALTFTEPRMQLAQRAWRDEEGRRGGARSVARRRAAEVRAGASDPRRSGTDRDVSGACSFTMRRALARSFSRVVIFLTSTPEAYYRLDWSFNPLP